jgi:hypothetical protein
LLTPTLAALVTSAGSDVAKESDAKLIVPED